MKEIWKFVLRFGLLASAIGLAYAFALRPDDIMRMLYKGTLALFGFSLGEIVWFVFFKLVFKATEVRDSESQKAVLHFRGLIDASFVLGLCLGL